MLKPEFVQITRQKQIAENEFYPMINALSMSKPGKIFCRRRF